MDKRYQIIIMTVALAVFIYIAALIKTRPKPPVPDPVYIEKQVYIPDTTAIVALQDSIDLLKLQVNSLKKKYNYDVKKIRDSIARLSDDELRSVLTKRYSNPASGN
jgi:hypothetical protein